MSEFDLSEPKADPDIIEIMAKAIGAQALSGSGNTSGEFAQAALTALREAGFVVVPAEPTEAMLKASPVVGTGIGEDGKWATNTKPGRDVYRAMVAAYTPKES
jgi:hypothetical protein